MNEVCFNPFTGKFDYIGLSERRAYTLFLTKPIEIDIDFYVATTGSDTDGDGTSVNPWATIQHALDKASGYRTNEKIIINVADGNYDEFKIPTTLFGVVLILGNTTSPADVTITSVSSDIVVDFTNSTSCNLQLDGFSIIGGLFGIYGIGNRVEIGAVYTVGTSYPVLSDRGTVVFSSVLSGRAILNGDSSAFGAGITAFNSAVIIDQQGIKADEHQTAVNLSDISTYLLEFGSANTLELTSVDLGSAICMQASNNSQVTLLGDANFDCVSAKLNTSCIRMSDSILVTLGGGTYNVENADKGVYGTGLASLEASAGTWNFSGNNDDVVIDKAAFAVDNFGVPIEREVSTTGKRLGSDKRVETIVNSATYTVGNFDEDISVDYTDTGSVDITLPEITKANDGVPIYITDTGNNASVNEITITADVADTIQYDTDLLMNSDGMSLRLKPNLRLNNWEIK